jgi:hypothetical protein
MSDSLQARVTAKRQQVLARRGSKLTLDVPDYEELLVAQYRLLPWEERTEITNHHEAIKDRDSNAVVGAAAEMLAKASVDILEIVGSDEQHKPQYQSLGHGWTTQFIASTFGLSVPAEYPIDEALRDALGSDAIMEHFGRYIDWVNQTKTAQDEAAQGEPGPSVEGSSN